MQGMEQIEKNGLQFSCMRFFNLVTFPAFFSYLLHYFYHFHFFPFPFHTLQKLLCGLPRVRHVGLEPTCPAPKRTYKDTREYKWISCQFQI